MSELKYDYDPDGTIRAGVDRSIDSLTLRLADIAERTRIASFELEMDPQNTDAIIEIEHAQSVTTHLERVLSDHILSRLTPLFEDSEVDPLDS